MTNESSEKIFIRTSEDIEPHENLSKEDPWVVLVIDDEQGVLDITYNVLKRFHFKGRSLQFEYATSLQEAIKIYQEHPKAAVALVDCTMEKNTSGLDFINFIRNQEKNTTIQLVLRTGQPGFAPENDVLNSYEINDYLSKTELTSNKLKHRMISYLRAYENLVTISQQNIALQKANEKISIQNDALEELDKIKDSFLSFVSHELKAPLRASQGITQLILSNNTIDKKLSEDIKLIESCNQRMELLVGDLIDSAMIRLNEFRVEFSTENLFTTVQAIMPNLLILSKYLDKDNKVIIKNSIADNFPLTDFDSSRIQQVITNLVYNALKYTESGMVEITAKQSDDKIIVSVIDTGQGIREEDIPKLFDMFTQANTLTMKSQEGLGLGLCIAKKIIESHHGDLKVSSKIGTGSCFSFEIPVHHKK
jgi:signal transduction histidine kinase